MVNIMTQQTVEKTEKYPCIGTPLDTLDEIVLTLSLGITHNAKNLLIGTCRIEITQVPWHSIQHLHILGSEQASCNSALQKMNFTPGAYISRCGTWLLVIVSDVSSIQEFIDTCGPRLQSLSVLNTNLETISFENNIGIERLVMHNNADLKKVISLEKLEQTAYMRCTSCPGISVLPGLIKLKQLKYLNLFKCSGLVSLAGIEKLNQLTYLNIAECKSLLSLPKFDCHPQLAALYLKDCSQIRNVDLSGCEELEALDDLDTLKALESINFSGCNKLLSISLCGCANVTTILGLETLFNVTELNLSSCKSLQVLPEGIRKMSALRVLNLQFLHLVELPYWLPEIAEYFTTDRWSHKKGMNRAVAYLHGTTIDDVDMSIFEQPYETVSNWFKEREMQILNEIKVVFLGDGEAGKTRTIARLMNDGSDPLDYINQSTPGIVIKDKKYCMDGRQFQIHYWDFGGQEIMHSMHRIFLTNQTMYVVLINARDDTQGDRAWYWLQNIQSFAPAAPVLLVLNKIDMNTKASVDERGLRGQFPNLTQVVRLSALTFNQDEFNTNFTDKLLEDIAKTGYLDAQWPASWLKVKETLAGMSSHYIMGNDYQKICKEAGVNSNQIELLHWFNNLGISFCCCEEEDYELEDYVVLQPDWITNGLYIMLFNECEGAQNGQLPFQSIKKLLKNAHSTPSIKCTMREAEYNTTAEIKYVLGVMRKFQLSLEIPGTDKEFIPMLCQKESTLVVKDLEDNPDVLEFRMAFDHLPENLLHRLMVERYAEMDIDNVWRTGALFNLPGTGISAVVVKQDKILKFLLSHTDPMHEPNTYLTMLKSNVDKLWRKMGLQKPTYSLVYKLDGRVGVFDYEELMNACEDGETATYSSTWRRKIPIKDILNQSAPKDFDNAAKLLNAIKRSCRHIQDEPEYRLKANPNGSGYTNGQGMEDRRNRRIRDDLNYLGFTVADQSQRSVSGTGAGVGELDFLLLDRNNEPWTIIEALRVTDGSKTDWNKHLNKLVGNYNSRGFSFLYLLTYVDATADKYDQIWNGYVDYIPKSKPDRFKYVSKSIVKMEAPNDPEYITVARCQYRCGDYTPVVYHIFARIPTQGE